MGTRCAVSFWCSKMVTRSHGFLVKGEKFTSSEEAQANPPSDVKIDDWKNWCKHFESDKFQVQSKANKNNREKNEIPHTSSSKSFIQRIYELEKMRTILSEEIEKGIEVNGRQILEKVLNVKYGYTRGVCHGVKLSSSTELELELESALNAEIVENEKRTQELDKPSSSTELELEFALNAERVENEKRTQELVVQLQSQNDKILDQNATINELKKNRDVLQS
ncbi:hypothetical protein V6N12_041784 [Hibiscus sabdariffa]|uniref:Uncharacterized protein n=1 Tax=Hibiscus sabdariffa TaxID=183260 RepID=A0ABR2AXG1_9ROSI